MEIGAELRNSGGAHGTKPATGISSAWTGMAAVIDSHTENTRTQRHRIRRAFAPGVQGALYTNQKVVVSSPSFPLNPRLLRLRPARGVQARDRLQRHRLPVAAER